MSRQDILTDLGSIYSKTGTALTTSYTSGAIQLNGQVTMLSLFVAVTKASAGSSMSNTLFKLQVLDTNGAAYDAITTLNDATGTTKIEQTLAATANATNYYLLQTSNLAPSISGWRVQAKADGATVAGDSCVVLAAVM